MLFLLPQKCIEIMEAKGRNQGEEESGQITAKLTMRARQTSWAFANVIKTIKSLQSHIASYGWPGTQANRMQAPQGGFGVGQQVQCKACREFSTQQSPPYSARRLIANAIRAATEVLDKAELLSVEHSNLSGTTFIIE